MIIDAHQHFWQYDTERHSWMDHSMSALRNDFLPPLLKDIYKEQGVDGCVAVQVDQTLEENDFLLGLTEKYAFIKGVVGWVDFRDENIDAVLETYVEKTLLKGFRHIVQGEPDPNFLLRPNFLRGISYLEKYDFTYDILIFPHQLGAALEFVQRFPHQKFVINHMAKPYIKDHFYDGWAVLMAAIAKNENVYCKLSGIITEADHDTWTAEQIRPYMDLALEAFGPDRIMYGSDWPVCLLAGSYGEVKKLATDFITELSTSEKAAIMGETATRFYNLK